MNALLLAGLAAAQTTGGEVPEINAQLFRPSIDGERSIWTDDASIAPTRYVSARVLMGYTHKPLIYLGEDGSSTVLVRHLVHNDVMAGVQLGRVRLGGYLPIYTRALGDGLVGTGIGDVALDAKVGVLGDEFDHPLGLSFSARVMLPTSNLAGLDSGGFGWEATAIVDKELGAWLLAANLGVKGQPARELENLTWGNAVVARLGASYAISDQAGLSLDWASQGQLSALDEKGGRASELMLGGYLGLGDSPLAARGGVGTGITRGIGSPDLRVVGAIAYEPPKIRDRDGDGLVDKEDACPDVPEDHDDYLDLDGCPEPTSVTLRFEDAQGTAISGVSATVNGQPVDGELGLEAGSYPLSASADTWAELSTTVTIPEGPPVELVQVMGGLPGTLTIKVTDSEGAPLSGNVLVEGAQGFALTDGVATGELAAGEYTVLVQSEGYFPRKVTLSVPQGGEETRSFQLEPEIAKVEGERIEISDSVYFETGQATIKPESYPLLDQVAQILIDNPGILKLRIEGHTDSRGSASKNQTLSEERAAAVLEYLVSQGVARERLESEGFGESKPLEPGNNEAAWSKNRRTDFFIAEQASDTEEGE